MSASVFRNLFRTSVSGKESSEHASVFASAFPMKSEKGLQKKAQDAKHAMLRKMRSSEVALRLRDLVP